MGKKEYLACLISLVMLCLTACSDNANKTGSEVSSGTSSAEEKDYGYGFDKFGFSRFDVETAESLTYENKTKIVYLTNYDTTFTTTDDDPRIYDEIYIENTVNEYLDKNGYDFYVDFVMNGEFDFKTGELIHSNEKTAFSFEILPPLKGTGIEKLYETIDTLREFDPKYINITTHRSEYVYKDLGNGLFQRNRLRRRPGTVAVAAAIQNKYNITVVPHLLCSGFTREETEYVLLDLQFLGITDLLVLRGDKAKHESVFTPEGDGYHHATELQEQINNFNKGIFVDGSEMKVTNTPFSYGVACYPEKHEEAPNIDTDIYWLKKKMEAGAEYAVTQLFYDNQKYFDFVERARKAGVTIPIIPGIKPFKKISQISMIPKTFKVDLPEELACEAMKCKTDEEAKQVGIEWCVKQCKELMEHGVPSIHFYSIGAVDSIKEVAKLVY